MKKWWTPQVARIKALLPEERRKIAVDLDPFLIINVSMERATKDSVRYPGGLYGKKWQGLIASIKNIGLLHPIIVCPISEDSGKYGVLFGGHRVVACRVLNMKVPAIIITPEQGR